MKKLDLSSQMKEEMLPVPAEFIDTFMPSASGEAIKVYLWLLRCSRDPSRLLSFSALAELFDMTEKKLNQTFLYWEEQGLLSLKREDNVISGAELLRIGGGAEPGEEGGAGEPLPVLRDAPSDYRCPASEEAPVSPEPVRRPLNLHELDEDEAFSDLLSLCEFYLKKPMTPTQRESLGYCYLLFDRQQDIVEYLLEYCIEQGHQSFHYIEAVARGWKEEGLSTLAEVKSSSAERNRTLYSIKKAYGITNRALVADENAMAEKWTKRFELPLILNAIGRTMSAIHSPSFRYTDRILSDWEEKGVSSEADVEALDRERAARAAKSGEQKAQPPVKNAFRNFDQRKTDYSELIPDFYEG